MPDTVPIPSSKDEPPDEVTTQEQPSEVGAPTTHADVVREVLLLVRDAITGSREVYVRLVLLLVIVAALVTGMHLAGVPMPWGTSPPTVAGAAVFDAARP